MHVQTHCPDGTDRNCRGTVPMELPYTGLTPDDVESHWEERQGNEELTSITISPPADPRWLIGNDRWLSQDDIDNIKVHGFFVVEADDFPPHDCCGACGSSETYDDEGNNITAL